MESLQKTIKNPVKISGLGLHTGNRVELLFKPAAINSGISFVRTDLTDKPGLKVDCDNLMDSLLSIRRTSLKNNGIEVQTIEHLMAVLSGLQLDNLLIELDNNEIPGMDGSGIEFLKVLKEAGIVEQQAVKKSYSIKEPIWVEEEQSMLVALPSNDYSIRYTLSYNHPLLKAQYMELTINPEVFEDELAASRTFCLQEEADDLQGRGLGKGANYENTLVI